MLSAEEPMVYCHHLSCDKVTSLRLAVPYINRETHLSKTSHIARLDACHINFCLHLNHRKTNRKMLMLGLLLLPVALKADGGMRDEMNNTLDSEIVINNLTDFEAHLKPKYPTLTDQELNDDLKSTTSVALKADGGMRYEINNTLDSEIVINNLTDFEAHLKPKYPTLTDQELNDDLKSTTSVALKADGGMRYEINNTLDSEIVINSLTDFEAHLKPKYPIFNDQELNDDLNGLDSTNVSDSLSVNGTASFGNLEDTCGAPLVGEKTNMSNQLVVMKVFDTHYDGLDIVSETEYPNALGKNGGPCNGTLSKSFKRLPIMEVGDLICKRGCGSMEYIIRPRYERYDISSRHKSDLISIRVIVVIHHNIWIQRLQQGSFNENNTIEILDLKKNRITFIEVGSFQNLTELRFLRLDSNEIESLQAGVFAGLVKIVEISLEFNRLKKCASGVFSELGNSLDYIGLTANRISKIERGCFNDTNLSTLNISVNYLEEINLTMFEELPQLRYLDLSFNYISFIEGFNNPSLRILLMEHNYITIINQTTFENLPLLTNLTLSRNHIWDFRDGATGGSMKNLKCLDLSRNPLKKMGLRSLTGCQKWNDCKVFLRRMYDPTIIDREWFPNSDLIFD